MITFLNKITQSYLKKLEILRTNSELFLSKTALKYNLELKDLQNKILQNEITY